MVRDSRRRSGGGRYLIENIAADTESRDSRCYLINKAQ